ncbi:hypothetical protein CEXT_291361 [Caerostris extrusa]|uniref:Uncharacterized protein n=1 Tax=Caerostris extrusa TaxID=172846 RepID=A0AAV4SCR8_CAEEX|nr:hypothetical protein CEXT_291361 [Caerostris extrusa]
MVPYRTALQASRTIIFSLFYHLSILMKPNTVVMLKTAPICKFRQTDNFTAAVAAPNYRAFRPLPRSILLEINSGRE